MGQCKCTLHQKNERKGETEKGKYKIKLETLQERQVSDKKGRKGKDKIEQNGKGILKN
jgi:hypothetical protein